MIKIHFGFKKGIVSLLCMILLLLIGSSPMDASMNPNANIKQCIEYPESCDQDDPPAAETTPETAAVSLSAWDYIKMILGLLFVLALLYGVLKFINSKNRQYQQHQLIQNLGGLSLGQHKSVQLLQIGDSLVLVGVGEDISILKEISDPAEKEKMLAFYNQKQEMTTQIPYIAELVKRFKPTILQNNTPDLPSGKFDQIFKKRLNEIKTDRSEGLRDWKKKENDRQ
ncbi:MAG: flagellar biosynthetic protein FliO [Paenisporosarcina sp.]